jgi:hypothetical protein
MQFAGAWTMGDKDAQALKKSIREDNLRQTKKLIEECA